MWITRNLTPHSHIPFRFQTVGPKKRASGPIDFRMWATRRRWVVVSSTRLGYEFFYLQCFLNPTLKKSKPYNS